MKKIIISAMFIIVLVTGYYFLSFLPSQKQIQTQREEQIFLFNKKTECKNICENVYQDDKDSLKDSTIFNPQYAYNVEKNACFYSGGWVSDKVLTKRIVNCQTNEEVLTFMTINNEVFADFCDTCANSSEEYKVREKEYMNN